MQIDSDRNFILDQHLFSGGFRKIDKIILPKDRNVAKKDLDIGGIKFNSRILLSKILLISTPMKQGFEILKEKLLIFVEK